ncbi:MAG: hypothetical protein QOD72_551 [Acidimicrobiaceae bacterium]|nr:hypothetical protein [Acidimicrobiaceae bacterium]
MSGVVGLADEYWDYFRTSAQLWNIDRGDVDQVAQWEDLSGSGVSRRIEELRGFAQRADDFPRDGLGDRELTLLGALSFSAGSTAVGLPYLRDLSLVAGPANFATFLSVFVPSYVLSTRAHGRGYVDKVRSVPAFVDGWISGLREGLAVGRVATARGVARAVAAYDTLLAAAISDDPLASQEPPIEASVAEVESWRAAVLAAVRDEARPAVLRLRDHLRDDVLPVARSDEQAGMCHLPDGEEGYAGLLWAATSTELTPAAIHQIGLDQFARLDDEYSSLGRVVFGIDDPAQIRDRLRDDQTLRYRTDVEIAHDARTVLARAEAEAQRWFTRVPRAGCAFVAVGTGPMAFYTGPSPDGSRGGTFYCNTSDPSAWRRFQLEVTTFHEAVPGHHFQLALAQELDLHPIVGELEVTSYGEGWGLYAERLADEMSLYTSPLQRMGMLTMDSLRAARLVADTGLHALGWTRDQAIEFVGSHTAHDRAGAEVEVDRYISDPGQATSYMIGRLALDGFRRHASDRLGEQFSLQQFHDVVLGHGMTPLDVLGRTVDAWIDRSL